MCAVSQGGAWQTPVQSSSPLSSMTLKTVARPLRRSPEVDLPVGPEGEMRRPCWTALPIIGGGARSGTNRGSDLLNQIEAIIR